MSRETANAARYAKGLCVLTELEGELLEALEGMCDVWVTVCDCNGHDADHFAQFPSARDIIAKSHGNT